MCESDKKWLICNANVSLPVCRHMHIFLCLQNEEQIKLNTVYLHDLLDKFYPLFKLLKTRIKTMKNGYHCGAL